MPLKPTYWSSHNIGPTMSKRHHTRNVIHFLQRGATRRESIVITIRRVQGQNERTLRVFDTVLQTTITMLGWKDFNFVFVALTV